MNSNPQQAAGLPKQKEEAITKLLERTGYQITTENGQRKYTPKTGSHGSSPKGSEVFVGKLPRDVFEDELVPLFERCGEIRELRLMMDGPGPANRGYGFVLFSNPEEAKRAIELLNGQEVRKGRHLGVVKSVDNCRLFVGGIPKNKTKEEILAEIGRVTEPPGPTRVILYSSVTDKSRNRGFAFVEFESHKAAAAARRRLMPGQVPIFGHPVAVDWAEPEPDVDEETMQKVTVLYVRNLMLSTSEDKLRELFSVNGTLRVDKVKKLRDFAFVHYRTRQDAEAALQQFHDTEIDESRIEVTWAKPADRANRQRFNNRTAVPMLFPPPLPGYDHYAFPACPGRGGLLPRLPPMRGRGRGAAGIRRFRNFTPNAYKPPEVVMPPPYPPYPVGKRPADKAEQFPSEYVFMPVTAATEDAPLAVPSFIAAHPRVPHHSYLYPPPGYDDVPYFAAYIAPGHPGAVSSY